MSETIRDITIKKTEKRTVNSKSYIVYGVNIHGPVRSWTVWKRYSDFNLLHTDLMRQVPSSTPPKPLPPKKSLFAWTTYDDPNLIEERQLGLETYLQAILKSKDDRWRTSRAWKTFLELGDQHKSEPALYTSEAWIEEFRDLSHLAKEVKSNLLQRNRLALKGDTSASYEAGRECRKQLSKLNAGVTLLEEGLRKEAELIHSTKDSEIEGALSSGELTRRQNLINNLKQETIQLEKSSKELFSARRMENNSSEPEPSMIPSYNLRQKTGIHGSSGSMSPVPSPRSNRRFGTNHTAPETDITRPLDSSGLIQLQRTMMENQDAALDGLREVIIRQKQMGYAIGEELDLQNELLEKLEGETEKVGSNLKGAQKRVDKVRKG